MPTPMSQPGSTSIGANVSGASMIGAGGAVSVCTEVNIVTRGPIPVRCPTWIPPAACM